MKKLILSAIILTLMTGCIVLQDEHGNPVVIPVFDEHAGHSNHGNHGHKNGHHHHHDN